MLGPGWRDGGKVADLRTQTSAAHRKQVEFSTVDIAKYLQEALGQKLVAYMTGVADPKTVGTWIKGTHPHMEAESRLRMAFQIFHLLQAEESPHTVRAWMIGMNPQLDDEAPAAAIREGRLKDVWVAAKAYTSGG